MLLHPHSSSNPSVLLLPTLNPARLAPNQGTYLSVQSDELSGVSFGPGWQDDVIQLNAVLLAACPNTTVMLVHERVNDKSNMPSLIYVMLMYTKTIFPVPQPSF